MTSFIVVSFVWRPKKNELRRSEKVELHVLHLRSFLRFLPYLSYMMILPRPLFAWSWHDSLGQKKFPNFMGICIQFYISKTFFMSRTQSSEMGTYPREY